MALTSIQHVQHNIWTLRFKKVEHLTPLFIYRKLEKYQDPQYSDNVISITRLVLSSILQIYYAHMNINHVFVTKGHATGVSN